MPSFVIHTVIGNELIKKLNLTEDDKSKFIIGNLLPDTKRIRVDSNLSEFEKRKLIQSEKTSTHFRTNEGVLEYPNMDLYISKYGELCKNNIIAFAYCFHLYTDYYYFKYYLPSLVKFLDENMKETDVRFGEKYVYVNKQNKLLPRDIFWSKSDNDGLYQEYSKISLYLLKKYGIELNFLELRRLLADGKFYVPIDEVDSLNGVQVVNALERIIKSSLEMQEEGFTIFSKDNLDEFINNVVDSFIKEYDDLFSIYSSYTLKLK